MDSFVWFQDHIPKAGDFKKYYLPMEDPEFDAEFDYKLEFSRKIGRASCRERVCQYV